jgi:electron transfer flavoprotein alpha/beta subunit
MNKTRKLLKWSIKKKKRALFFIPDSTEFHYVTQTGLRLAAILRLVAVSQLLGLQV